MLAVKTHCASGTGNLEAGRSTNCFMSQIVERFSESRLTACPCFARRKNYRETSLSLSRLDRLVAPPQSSQIVERICKAVYTQC